MKKKSCLFIVASIFISMISFSQTIKENIEKQSKDPKTAENAAKADVFIPGNKKTISDTTTRRSSNSTNRISKTSRKTKRCSKS
jgi:hypothetical protein